MSGVLKYCLQMNSIACANERIPRRARKSAFGEFIHLHILKPPQIFIFLLLSAGSLLRPGYLPRRHRLHLHLLLRLHPGL